MKKCIIACLLITGLAGATFAQNVESKKMAKKHEKMEMKKSKGKMKKEAKKEVKMDKKEIKDK